MQLAISGLGFNLQVFFKIDRSLQGLPKKTTFWSKIYEVHYEPKIMNFIRIIKMFNLLKLLKRVKLWQ